MASRVVKGIGAAGVATLAGALYWRRNPSPCPFGQRWALSIPRPVLSRRNLAKILEPLPGELILEVGPGAGHFSLEVASLLAPDGKLSVFDIQQEMLDLVTATAEDRALSNIEATQGTAERLPYTENSFDGAFLVTVLGEIPDQNAALHELARVTKPGGRVVVGEIFGDPHMVGIADLKQKCAEAGLVFDTHLGNRLAFFARFRASV